MAKITVKHHQHHRTLEQEEDPSQQPQGQIIMPHGRQSNLSGLASPESFAVAGAAGPGSAIPASGPIASKNDDCQSTSMLVIGLVDLVLSQRRRSKSTD